MTKQKDTQTITQSDSGPSHSKQWVILIQVAAKLYIQAPGGSNNENQIDFVWVEDCWRPQTEKVVSCQA